jgi:2-polyprenyl-3-methyl-5-hydroxy-6-metoxy-1,4-benzoquinol methylase
MNYAIKKKVNKGLKSIHNFILKFGIDVSFVKKEDSVSACQHNAVYNSNEQYSSRDHLNEITSKEHQKFFKELIVLLELNGIDLSGKMVADVGCGIGNLLSHVGQRYDLAGSFGFDFSQVAIDYANSRGIKAVFFQHDIYVSLERQFDFLFCTEVLEHLLYPGKALFNLESAIKPGGGLLITVPDGRKDTWSGHINFWSPESWQIFIQENTKGMKFTAGNISGRNLYALIIA